MEEGCDKGTANADLCKQDQAALAELNYNNKDVEDFEYFFEYF